MKHVLPKFESPIVPGVYDVFTGAGRAEIVVSGIDLGEPGFMDNDSMLGPSRGSRGSEASICVEGSLCPSISETVAHTPDISDDANLPVSVMRRENFSFSEHANA